CAHMRTLHVISPRRTPSRKRFVNTMGKSTRSPAEFAPKVIQIEIVLAGVFDNLGIGHQARLFLYCPGLRINLGVIDRNLNFQVPEVRPSETLGDMQRLGSWLAGLIQPGFSVETTRVDDEGVAIPFTG